MRLRLRIFIAVLLLAMPAMAAGPAWAAGAVTVSGARLLRDGAPWRPKGLTVVGLLSPAPSPFPMFAAAQAHWGPAELVAAKQFGADTIRLQVSQQGLDPQSPFHVKDYMARVAEAGRTIRSDGFALILSMQSRGTGGVVDPPTMPDAATSRAWAALAPDFAADPGTMFELFNEPIVPLQPPYTAEKFKSMWAQWQDAHQRLVTQIRAAGATNVLILDGAQTANFLNDVPLVSDKLSRLAYAVHPYLTDTRKDEHAWQSNFGAFAASHPVIASEWDMDSKFACVTDGPAAARRLIDYLRAKDIGLVGWALDIPGTIVRDFTFAPSDLSGFQCGPAGHNGAGQLISESFHAGG